MLCANVSLSERRGQACLGYAERKKRRRSQPYIKAPHGVFCLYLKCRFTLNYMSVVSLLTRFCLFRAP